MDPTTIPYWVWEDCSRRAEALMIGLFATSTRDERTYRNTLREEQYRNEFRDFISNYFYHTLYSKANLHLAYTNSDLVGEGADPGWQEFTNVANTSQDDVRAWMATDAANQRTMRTPPATARWIADNERAICQFPRCRKAFSAFTRKHHCRLCGEIFCDDHSRRQILVQGALTPNGREPVGVQRNERVCDSCYNSFSQKVHSPLLRVQGDMAELNKVRPWAYITLHGTTVARIQFVVSTGGGMVLFSRLNQSFHSYFLRYPDRKNAFHGFKVFSEEYGNGRSDSAVVYLCQKSNHRFVKDWWQSAVSGNAEFRSSLQTNASAYGLRDMRHGGWAIDLPRRETETAVLGASCDGSAGGLIGNLIGVSFWLAAKAGEKNRVNKRQPCIPADPDLGTAEQGRLKNFRPHLIAEAKAQLRELISQL